MTTGVHADPCVSEPCSMCPRPATHKVAEDDSRNHGLFRRHPLTNYVCCECFGKIMGSFAMERCGVPDDAEPCPVIVPPIPGISNPFRCPGIVTAGTCSHERYHPAVDSETR